MTVLGDLSRDLRYSARALARSPGFTIVAVAVLALGIGANSAIFSLVNAVWLKPLPFADAERIVTLWIDLSAIGGAPRMQVTPGHYDDWQARSQSFESMTGIEPSAFNLTSDDGEPERLIGVRTTPNLFETIGLQPILGRTFEPDDAGNNGIVVSEGFWLRRLGGDPAAVGRTITLDGSPHTIVGVVPRDFRFPEGENEVFIPTAFAADVFARRTSYNWYVVAKLLPDVELKQAQAEMRAVAASLDAEFPQTGRGAAASVVPLHEQLAGTVRPTMLALVGAVALVLLIACGNVANLMLARATVRQKELAIRKALGAARGRVLRQLLAESVVLAGVSAVVGLIIAAACLGYLERLLPSTLPASTTLGLDPRVLALTIATAFVAVLLFGAGPAFAAARRDFGAVFGRTVGTHKATRRLRTALVVGEIALTVVLLAGAGLLLRSYQAVLAVDPGFDAEGVLVAETVLAPARYPDAAARDGFYRRVLERVRALPGVESAAFASYAPLLLQGGGALVFVEGRPRPEPSEIVRNMSLNRAGSAGYFETLRVPLLRGRFIDERDTRDAPRSVVINETMAQTHWPDEDPLGRRFSLGSADGGPMTIVGVVADVRETGLDVPSAATVYLPIDQARSPFMWPRQLMVRAAGDPLRLAPAVRTAVWDVDPDQPVSSVRTMSEVLDAELANRNLQLTVIGAFAAIALVLAAVGLYGTLSYTVSQSTNEIGLRMALGAQRRTVIGAIVRTALGTALLGVVLGLAAAFALTRTIASFLYGVSPTDPATAAAVAGVLLAVACLAAFVPARRAANIDPVTALRAEG